MEEELLFCCLLEVHTTENIYCKVEIYLKTERLEWLTQQLMVIQCKKN